MEIACVVCGSSVGQRVSRCFVCGADLPPTPMTNGQQGGAYTPEHYLNLTALVKTPLSVGALPLEAVLSKRPSPQALEKSSTFDGLLGPEELSISATPEPLEPFMGLGYSPLPLKSLDEAKPAAPEQLGNEYLEIPEETDGEEEISTWIGIPIPQDLKLEYAPVDEQKSIERFVSTQQRSQDNILQLRRESAHTGDEVELIEAEVSPDRWMIGEEKQGSEYVHGQLHQRHEPSSPPVGTALRITLPELSLPPQRVEDPHVSSPSLPIPIPEGVDINISLSPEVSITSSHAQESIISPVINHLSAPPHQERVEPPSRPPIVSAPAFETPLSITRATIILEEDPAPSQPILPQAQNRWLRGILWTTLALVSLFVGIGGAILMKQMNEREHRAQIACTSVQIQGSRYLVQLEVNTNDAATLIVPDNWRGVGESPVISIKGQSQVRLSLPKEQLSLGVNHLRALWTFQQGSAVQSKPALFDVPLDWQSEEVGILSSGEARFGLRIAKYSRIVEASLPFEPDETTGQYHLIASSSELEKLKTGDAQIEVSFTLADQAGKKVEYKARYQLPNTPTPLVISSPTHRYARPEDQVMVSGSTAPLAEVHLVSLKTTEAGAVTAPEDVSTRADAEGVFSIKIPLSHEGKIPQEGQVWTVELEARTKTSLPSRALIEVKRSHEPTWSKYIARLEKRRDKAVSKYRLVTPQILGAQPDQMLKKPARIKGVIAWISRGAQAEEQRLLIHTCAQDDGCPIWVKDPNAFWVMMGQTVHVFGVIEENLTATTSTGRELTAPLLRARLTTP